MSSSPPPAHSFFTRLLARYTTPSTSTLLALTRTATLAYLIYQLMPHIRAILPTITAQGKTTKQEEIIAKEIIDTQKLTFGFEEIGGLEREIEIIKDHVLLPLLHPHLTAGNPLIAPPKGMLLYGPPGCGKTILAKAIAKEANTTFLSIHASTLLSNWYGESNKLVSALFSLARKRAPTIVFIDEIDAILRTRNQSEHEATAMVKAEFMQLWDGLGGQTDENGKTAHVLIIGATNRIHDIDEAILRRLPMRFEIQLPDDVNRSKILKKILKNAYLESNFDYVKLAAETDDFTGSDLRELCTNAAMIPVRERLKSSNMTSSELSFASVRPLEMADFLAALQISGRSALPSLYETLTDH